MQNANVVKNAQITTNACACYPVIMNSALSTVKYVDLDGRLRSAKLQLNIYCHAFYGPHRRII